MSILSLHYVVFGNNFNKAGEASSNLKKTLQELGYDKDIIRRIVISMYEAEMNMVLHAGGGIANVDILPDKVTVLTRDNGPGIVDIKKAMQEGFSTASDAVRTLGFGAGMGLPNIKKYADEFNIISIPGKGTSMFISVNIKQ